MVFLGNFEGIIQYNKDNRPGQTANITINTLCDIMITSKGSPVEKLAEVNNFLLQATNEECLDYSYETMIQELSEVSWDSEAGEGGRQWTYQVKFKCSEKATKVSHLIFH